MSKTFFTDASGNDEQQPSFFEDAQPIGSSESKENRLLACMKKWRPIGEYGAYHPPIVQNQSLKRRVFNIFLAFWTGCIDFRSRSRALDFWLPALLYFPWFFANTNRSPEWVEITAHYVFIFCSLPMFACTVRRLRDVQAPPYLAFILLFPDILWVLGIFCLLAADSWPAIVKRLIGEASYADEDSEAGGEPVAGTSNGFGGEMRFGGSLDSCCAPSSVPAFSTLMTAVIWDGANGGQENAGPEDGLPAPVMGVVVRAMQRTQDDPGALVLVLPQDAKKNRLPPAEACLRCLSAKEMDAVLRQWDGRSRQFNVWLPQA